MLPWGTEVVGLARDQTKCHSGSRQKIQIPGNQAPDLSSR
jgi:hypothetical protein